MKGPVLSNDPHTKEPRIYNSWIWHKHKHGPFNWQGPRSVLIGLGLYVVDEWKLAQTN